MLSLYVCPYVRMYLLLRTSCRWSGSRPSTRRRERLGLARLARKACQELHVDPPDLEAKDETAPESLAYLLGGRLKRAHGRMRGRRAIGAQSALCKARSGESRASSATGRLDACAPTHGDTLKRQVHAEHGNSAAFRGKVDLFRLARCVCCRRTRGLSLTSARSGFANPTSTTCWVASALQALFATGATAGLVTGHSSGPTCSPCCALCALKTTHDASWRPSQSPDLIALWGVWLQSVGRDVTDQHDAGEFLQLLLAACPALAQCVAQEVFHEDSYTARCGRDIFVQRLTCTLCLMIIPASITVGGGGVPLKRYMHRLLICNPRMSVCICFFEHHAAGAEAGRPREGESALGSRALLGRLVRSCTWTRQTWRPRTRRARRHPQTTGARGARQQRGVPRQGRSLSTCALRLLPTNPRPVPDVGQKRVRQPDFDDVLGRLGPTGSLRHRRHGRPCDWTLFRPHVLPLLRALRAEDNPRRELAPKSIPRLDRVVGRLAPERWARRH